MLLSKFGLLWRQNQVSCTSFWQAFYTSWPSILLTLELSISTLREIDFRKAINKTLCCGPLISSSDRISCSSCRHAINLTYAMDSVVITGMSVSFAVGTVPSLHKTDFRRAINKTQCCGTWLWPKNLISCTSFRHAILHGCKRVLLQKLEGGFYWHYLCKTFKQDFSHSISIMYCGQGLLGCIIICCA